MRRAFFLLSKYPAKTKRACRKSTAEICGLRTHAPLQGCVHFLCTDRFPTYDLRRCRIKHGNGGCFGFVPNFLDLFSLQLFDPYNYLYYRAGGGNTLIKNIHTEERQYLVFVIVIHIAIFGKHFDKDAICRHTRVHHIGESTRLTTCEFARLAQ